MLTISKRKSNRVCAACKQGVDALSYKTMATNIEVAKTPNETNTSLIRKFSKRLQEARVLARSRKLRFFERPESKLRKKARKLRQIERGRERKRLWKLGKI